MPIVAGRFRWAACAAILGTGCLLVLGARLDQDLLLAHFLDHRDSLLAFAAARPLTTFVLYMLGYMAYAAAHLPGTAIFSIAGGGLFGLWPGFVAACLARSLGALGGCATARCLLRRPLQDRFRERLRPINQGIARDGAFYLFTLRLTPVFPFAAANVACGLSYMPLSTFFLTTLLASTPNTLLWANAGQSLISIRSVGDVFSYRVLAALFLLGLFPLAAKIGLRLFSARRGKASP